VVPHIDVRGISLSYHWRSYHRQIFDQLNLRIQPAEYVSVIGSNGSGKTSLIKLILGLVKPDSGSIKIAGRDVIYGFPLDVREGKIAYISQNIQDMFFSETVGEELTLSNISTSPPISLGDTLDPQQRIRDLSGGERQRLGLQIFMSSQAPLLLLDEPSSFLDHQNSQILKKYLAEANDAGKTILHLTQYPAEVAWGSHVLDLDQETPEVHLR